MATIEVTPAPSVSVHEPVPGQSGVLQPTKVLPDSGLALSVTDGALLEAPTARVVVVVLIAGLGHRSVVVVEIDAARRGRDATGAARRDLQLDDRGGALRRCGGERHDDEGHQGRSDRRRSNVPRNPGHFPLFVVSRTVAAARAKVKEAPSVD